MKIVRYVGDSKERFGELVGLVLGKDEKLAQFAAWPFSYVVESNPELILPFYARCLKKLKQPCHNAVRRNILDAFQAPLIPVKFESSLVEMCFRLLVDPSEFVAVKAIAMTLIGRLSVKYPELKRELHSAVELQWEHASPGFKSRAKKILNL